MMVNSATETGAQVALFLPSLLGGGAERVMVRLAREFVRRGVRTDLVLARATGPYLHEIASQVRLIDLGARRVLTSLPRLIHYLRRERPNTMLSTLAHANIIAALARRIACVPVRLVVREAIAPLSQAKNTPLLKARLTTALIRLYRSADAIVANSAYVATELSHLVGLPVSQIFVIPNPVVDAQLLAASQRPVNHPWFADPRTPLVLSAGRLSPQKDFATLVRAIALVNQQLPCRLVILGEGEQRSMLEQLAWRLGLQEKLWMPGFESNPYRYMARASVFALSSRWEGSPNTVIEALACGVPVVATDCPGGTREILEDGKWGKLVPVGDVEALAAALVESIQHPPCRELLRQRAQAFTVERVANQYLSVLGLTPQKPSSTFTLAQ